MINLNDSNFKQEVLDFKGIVVVDFFADWCNPCKAFASIFEEFGSENEDVKCVKVNVDDSGLARKYRVMSIPTVVLFKDGEVKDRFVGVMQKKDLADFVAKNR